MATIYIEGRPYEVSDGQNLLQACLSLGFDVPYFCWHPAFGSVGACRQCAVKQFKDESDSKGKIVMACMTPAIANTRISIDDPEARQFRASVIEWLMVNHPHDCPVCDEGGECHLQDMTCMTGHNYRKFRFKKRTHRNQDLGPFVTHEMNRCIACYRCVRYYREYAEGRDLDVFGAHNHVYFGRHTDGVLENEFSGNLVEVCPTGVFTDKTLAFHYTRKWDLQTAPSICVHCSAGCNTIPGERYGMLRRIRNRYHHEVNGYFLCDRGRYGYEFVNSEKRLRQPLFRAERNGPLQPISAEEALQRAAVLVSDKSRLIGIGSPRASLESNFALRALVGPERFYMGISADEHKLLTTAVQLAQSSPARIASLQDVESSDAVLVLGEDVTNFAPMVALALRQASRRQPMKEATKVKIPGWHAAAIQEVILDKRGPFFVVTPGETKLEEAATNALHLAPDDIARLGFAIANILDPQAPPVPQLPESMQKFARDIAAALQSAERPLVVSGTGCGSGAVLHAAAQVAASLVKSGHPAQLCLTVPECNSLGIGLMGGNDLDAAFIAVKERKAETVIILENDLYRRAPAASVSAFLESAPHLIVLDVLANPTTEKAELVLPAAAFAEADGTLVNNEGRAQRFYEVFVPADAIQASWRWLSKIMPNPWPNWDSVLAALAEAMPIFRPVTNIAPPAGFRIAGEKIARQPHRYSGRTAMHANETVHEPPPPDDPDTPLAYSMEGFQGVPPSSLIPRYWSPGWNSDQAVNKFQAEVGGELQGGSPGVRLIEPAKTGEAQYSSEIPPPFAKRDGEWLLAPLYHIFGSEELSVLSPGIAELTPKPYLALNPEDATRLNAAEGDTLTLTLQEISYRLPLRPLPSLPSGLAGLPAGLPQSPTLPLPTWAKIAKEAR